MEFLQVPHSSESDMTHELLVTLTRAGIKYNRLYDRVCARVSHNKKLIWKSVEIRNQSLEIRNQVRNHDDLKSHNQFSKVLYPGIMGKKISYYSLCTYNTC